MFSKERRLQLIIFRLEEILWELGVNRNLNYMMLFIFYGQIDTVRVECMVTKCQFLSFESARINTEEQGTFHAVDTRRKR